MIINDFLFFYKIFFISEEYHHIKLAKLKKDLEEKMSKMNLLAWKVRNAKVIRRIMIKNKQLENKRKCWSKYNLQMMLKIEDMNGSMKGAIKDLKEKNTEINSFKSSLRNCEMELLQKNKVKKLLLTLLYLIF